MLYDTMDGFLPRIGGRPQAYLWEQRFGHLRELSTLDVCYWLLVADQC